MNTVDVRRFLLKSGWYTANIAAWLSNYSETVDCEAVKSKFNGCCNVNGIDLFRQMQCEVTTIMHVK